LAAAQPEGLHGVDGKNSTAPPTPSPSVQARRPPSMCGRTGRTVPRPAAAPPLRTAAWRAASVARVGYRRASSGLLTIPYPDLRRPAPPERGAGRRDQQLVLRRQRAAAGRGRAGPAPARPRRQGRRRRGAVRQGQGRRAARAVQRRLLRRLRPVRCQGAAALPRRRGAVRSTRQVCPVTREDEAVLVRGRRSQTLPKPADLRMPLVRQGFQAALAQNHVQVVCWACNRHCSQGVKSRRHLPAEARRPWHAGRAHRLRSHQRHRERGADRRVRRRHAGAAVLHRLLHGLSGVGGR